MKNPRECKQKFREFRLNTQKKSSPYGEDFWRLVECFNDIRSSFPTTYARSLFCDSISIGFSFDRSDKLIDLTLSDDIIRSEVGIADIHPSLWYTEVYIWRESICVWKISEFLLYRDRSISVCESKKLEKLCTSDRIIWSYIWSILHNSKRDKLFDRSLKWALENILCDNILHFYNWRSRRSHYWERTGVAVGVAVGVTQDVPPPPPPPPPPPLETAVQS